MREKIELPDDYSEIPQAERKQPECSPEEFKAYATDDSLVPAMPAFGSGYPLARHRSGTRRDRFPERYTGCYFSRYQPSA